MEGVGSLNMLAHLPMASRRQCFPLLLVPLFMTLPIRSYLRKIGPFEILSFASPSLQSRCPVYGLDCRRRHLMSRASFGRMFHCFPHATDPILPFITSARSIPGGGWPMAPQFGSCGGVGSL